MPRRSSDNYIQLQKKITNKDVIKVVGHLSKEWLLSPTETCYQMITEYAKKEIDRRQKIEDFKRQNK